MASSSGTATALGLNGNEQNLYNKVRANLDPAHQASLPRYESRDDKVQLGEAIKGQPGLANAWFDAMIDKVAATYVTQIVTHNQYQVLEKEPMPFGGVMEDTAVDRVGLQEFDVYKTPQRQLAINPPRVLSAFYKVNFSGQYQGTPLSRQDALRAFTTEGSLFQLVDAATSAIARSWDLDNRDMYNYTFGNAYFKGNVGREVLVTETGDADEDARTLAEAISYTAQMICSPRSDYNQSKYRSATRPEDLFLIADAKTMARLRTRLFSSVFNLEFVKLPGHLIEIDQFDNIDWAAFQTYIENTSGLVEYTSTQKQFLAAGKLKAFLIDGEWIRTHLQNYEMGTFQLPMGSAFNANLNVSKIYATRPWANSVAFVSQSYARPTEFVFTVTEISRTSTVTQVTLKAPDGLSFQWVTDQTATSWTVSDDVLIADNDASPSPSIQVASGVKTLAAPIDLDTITVGSTVEFE